MKHAAGVVTAMIGLNLACAGQVGIKEPSLSTTPGNPTIVPDWRVEELEVTDKCTRLMDYCIAVSCAVQSHESPESTHQVELWVAQGGDEIVHYESVTLGPGSRQSLRGTFPEARLFGKQPRGGCRVKAQGYDVPCTVSNHGGGGNVRVTAELTDQNFDEHRGQLDVEMDADEVRTVVVHVDVPGGELAGDKYKYRCHADPR